MSSKIYNFYLIWTCIYFMHCTVSGPLQTSSHHLVIAVIRYAQIPLEENLPIVWSRVEADEHCVCQWVVFLWNKRERPLQRLWPTTQGNGIWEPIVTGVFLARTQETKGEVVGQQQYRHTSSSIKTITTFFSPITPNQVNQWLHKWAPSQNIAKGYQ